MITKQHDRKRGTWVYDLGDYRGIVYKVGGDWLCRVGVRSSGRIAPEGNDCHQFRLRGEAEDFAREWLEARTHSENV